MRRELFELMGAGKVRRALMRGLFNDDMEREAQAWLPHAETIRKESFERTRNWIAGLAILVTLLVGIIAKLVLG